MYRFVFQGPKSSSSSERRLAELQDAEARSHAAKIAYLKKRARKQLAQLDQGNVTKPSEDELARFATGKYPYSAESEIQDEEPLTDDQPQKVPLNRRSSHPLIKGNKVPNRTKSSPRSLLPQTTQDPFDSFPERKLPENVERVVQYGKYSPEVQRRNDDKIASHLAHLCRTTLLGLSGSKA